MEFLWNKIWVRIFFGHPLYREAVSQIQEEKCIVKVLRNNNRSYFLYNIFSSLGMNLIFGATIFGVTIAANAHP